MKWVDFTSLTLLAGFSVLTSACAGGSDRYPSLSVRDFERVRGQFTSPKPVPESLRPAPLSVEEVAQIETSLADAMARHADFLAQAGQARAIVSEAAGSEPEDNRWSLAIVEIASLDSKLSVTTGLLAQLDALYADASLAFEERTAIAVARNDVQLLVAAQEDAIDALVDLLESSAVASPQS